MHPVEGRLERLWGHEPLRDARQRVLDESLDVEGGAGVLFIYEGDVMNFQLAAEMAGREVQTVLTDDDVAVETSSYSTGRRGVAGTLIVEKLVGAAAEEGRPLAALRRGPR